jgi:hypothetical protein
MNIIDQRILIPANPDVIWQVISNMSDNPKWQVNCQNVSFLTTNHREQGMRYRSSSPKGRETVIEITAWYENVGYAYKIVDGISTRNNSGRFRLQEITEGTIVQWMFEYEPSGLLGGIKNSLGTKRTFEREIVQSLENLWRVITELQAGKPYVSRTAMREAPDVESRAQYKARHDNKRRLTPDEEAPKSDPISAFLQADEPAIKHDDTRPHPASPTPPAGIAPVLEDSIFNKQSTTSNEPDFLKSLEKTVETSDHSIFQPPSQTTAEVIQDQPSIDPISKPEPITESDSLFSFEQSETTPEPTRFTESIFDEPVEQTPLEAEKPSIVESVSEPEQSEPIQPIETIEKAVEAPTDTPSVSPISIIEPPIKDDDTSQMSIFEIFGVPKPSETQQMPAVVIDEPQPISITPTVIEASAPASIEPVSAPPSAQTGGLRAKLRTKNSKTRKRS